VGGNLGHATVTDLGRSMQVAAVDGDANKLRLLLSELQSYVSSVTGVDEAELLAVSPSLQMQLRDGGGAGGASPRVDGGASGAQSVDISAPLGSLVIAKREALRVPESVTAAAVAAAPHTLQVPSGQTQLAPSSVVTFKKAVIATHVKVCVGFSLCCAQKRLPYIHRSFPHSWIRSWWRWTQQTGTWFARRQRHCVRRQVPFTMRSWSSLHGI